MRYFLIILAFLSTKTFAQEDGNELWKTIRAKEARGLDSLLGMKKNAAMPILAKYSPTKLNGYFYKSEILKIENFNKWQHISNLYIYIDSDDRVCKLNYYFNDEMPAKIAEFFQDSMLSAVPTGRDLPSNYDFGYGRKIQIGTIWKGFTLQDDKYSESHRLFWEMKKPLVKAIYSIGKLHPDIINYCSGRVTYDDIFEPQSFDTNLVYGDSILHNCQSMSEKRSVEEDQITKDNRAISATGFDYLLEMPGENVMITLGKFHPLKLIDKHYPFIKEVYLIENFNKWQQLATLYLFVDSSDKICKMNYFFTQEMASDVAENLEDSMSWGLPVEKYPPLDTGVLYMDGLPGRPKRHRFVNGGWSGIVWQGHFLNRLFFQTGKPMVRAIYSNAIADFEKYAPHNGEILRDDIYEPVLERGR